MAREREHVNKGAWTKEEDEILSKHITEHGVTNWKYLPRDAGISISFIFHLISFGANIFILIYAAGLSRCGKSCRLRWINYLKPDLRRGSFTREETAAIIDLHRLHGNKYISISLARAHTLSLKLFEIRTVLAQRADDSFALGLRTHTLST